MKHDNYSYWRACLKAKREGTAKPEPSSELYPCGYFKQHNGSPCAIWPDPENRAEVIILVGTVKNEYRMKSETAEGRLEYGGFGDAVTEADYQAARATGEWPWHESAVPGGNAAPEEGSVEDYEAKIAEVEKKIAAAIEAGVKTQQDADALQNLRDRATKLKGAAVDQHAVEKRPHLEAGREVDGKWFPLRDRADAIARKAAEVVGLYLKKAREEAARKAAEDEKKLREENAAKPPEEQLPPEEIKVEPEKPRVGNTRKASLKKVKVAKIVDLEKAVAAALAAQSNSWRTSIEEVMQKIANAAMRADKPLDGVEFTEEEVAS